MSDLERQELEVIVRQSSAGVAKIRWARILLLADEVHPEGRFPDGKIAVAVGISERQVVRIRQKFVREGVGATLKRSTRVDSGTQRAMDGQAEAHLISLACSTPPAGRDHWTLELLCDEMSRLQVVQSVSRETVRKMLKKTNFSLGKPNVSASPKPTVPASSPGWKNSSTFIRNSTMKGTVDLYGRSFAADSLGQNGTSADEARHSPAGRRQIRTGGGAIVADVL